MQTEIEAKWLDVDLDKMRQKLDKFGATLVYPERLMIRKVCDFPDQRLMKTVMGWVRVRSEGHRTTLCYKQLNDRTLHGTKEITVVVDDFDTTCDFLKAIGIEAYAVQETKRESWKFEDVEIELDTWPWVPSFIEIEAKDEDQLKLVSKKLGLNLDNAIHGSTDIVYQAYYNIGKTEVETWPEIRFGDVPDWLAARAKKL